MTPQTRLAALRRFAVAISVLNLVGHLWLGFEPSWLQLLVAVGTAYATEIALELADAWARRRPTVLRSGSPLAVVDFLLSAHITGLAVSMLMYANDRLLPFAFAAAVGIASKAIFRAPAERRHFLNPSNTGLALTLILFPWVSIAPPYQFTENVAGALDWVVPGVIICTGSFLNGRFTKRLPLVAAWLGGFAAQALVRSLLFGTPAAAALGSMTGMAFLLFTFYMVPDPGTTPEEVPRQVLFGLAVAGAYGLLQMMHVVFGLFFALLSVCTVRGLLLHSAAALGAQPAEATGLAGKEAA
jgi:hypothetical protein